MLLTRGWVRRRRFFALAVFVIAILAAFNVGSWSLYSRQRNTLERLLRQRLTTATRLISAKLATLDLDFERDRAAYYLVRDVFREVQESDPDLSAVCLLDNDDRVVVAYPPEEIQEGALHPSAELDRGPIQAARAGFFVAAQPQSRESFFFMNAYGPVLDLFGHEFVAGLKADVGYQRTIDSLRYGILLVNIISGLAVLGFAIIYHRAGRRIAQEEEATFRREKLATLGQLAGGVAHEIRNPLGIVKQAAFLLRKQTGMTSEGKEWLDYMDDAVRRMNHLVEDVLAYARKGKIEIKEGELADTVGRALHLVKHRIDTQGIQVERLHDGPCSVAYDPDRMEQVAVNLLLNAIEAMPKGGRITIRTRCAADGAELDVEDTGPGIPPDQLEHIMEPFHTGKETGTGLGLAIVQHIVESHGGTVTVRSKVGEGTCFTVRLPRGNPPGEEADS